MKWEPWIRLAEAALVVGLIGFAAVTFLGHALLDRQERLLAESAWDDSAAVASALRATQYREYWLYPLPENGKGLRVLFIGNSFTYVYDLPQLVAHIGASDTPPVAIQPALVSQGGQTQPGLWGLGIAQKWLRDEPWDYVVLQPNSIEAANAPFAQALRATFRSWAELIRAAGAKTVVYEPWARKPGTDWYTRKRRAETGFSTPLEMQAGIDKVVGGAAAEIGAQVVPAADRWAACLAMKDAPELFYEDGVHPSLAGSYLNALMVYRVISGHKLDGVGFAPPGLAPEEVAFLKKCAAGF